MVGLVAALAAAALVPQPQPQAISFWDARNGLVALRTRYDCDAPHPGTIAATWDGGRTWHERRHGCPSQLDTAPGGAAWALGPHGLLRSLDGGRRWRFVTHRPLLAVSFATASSGWALARNPSPELERPLLLATLDGGHIWRRIRNPCDRSVSFAQGETISRPTRSRGWIRCAGQPATDMTSKAVFETRDAGRTWRLRSRTGDRGRRVGRVPIIGYLGGIDFAASGIGWMWNLRGGFYRTRDGGRSWVALPVGEPDVVESPSASLVDGRTGFALFRDGRKRVLELLATLDGGGSWHTRRTWPLA